LSSIVLKALTYRGGICTNQSVTVLEDRGSFENIKVNNLSSININSHKPNLEIDLKLSENVSTDFADKMHLDLTITHQGFISKNVPGA
jgi:hypothetical protein